MVPFLLYASFLYFKFKFSFSLQERHNILKISWLMLAQNFLDCFLLLARYQGESLLAGSFKSQQERNQFVLGIALISVFLLVWVSIQHIARQKNGDYEAPLGYLYIRQKEYVERNEERLSKEQLEESRAFIEEAEQIMTKRNNLNLSHLFNSN
mmetsp:Transcript_3349/g.5590  ORF Transcript_3349/g.5590 Transcript_3349/m.5590 type:complete len:153 (+) Transcript_3349:248-706(+)